ncbi:MAG: carboxymuconolactone decarboxylase family protein [Actinomycetota bacterium]|jgi:4-carboxymuconolactone decarboxylase|nr:carboxymuconolactone decarboxylase family protein [Actinomycetota bacterium]
MSDRPDSFRIEPITEADDELQELLGKTLILDGRPANIFGVMAKHPKLLKRFNVLGGFILNKGLVPEREREVVILRVGANCVAKYEFGQHTGIGRRCGLTDEEIVALLRPADAHPWSDNDAALIAMTDELCADDCVTDKTFARLKDRWSEAEIMELTVTAGFYRMVSGFLNTMGVELDDGVPDFPEPPSTGV